MTYIEDKTEAELVDDIGKKIIGTSSGLDAQFSQAELTRRLIVNIKDLNKGTSFYSKVIIVLTIVLAFFVAIQIYFAVEQVSYSKKQTGYTEMQSRPERIRQAQTKQRALEFCKDNPESENSGLYYIQSGNLAHCSEILEE